MGSGSASHGARAESLGVALAGLPVHLLTGGGRGVMEAVSRGFASVPDRLGRVIAILPAADEGGRPPEGYPNAWIEIPVQTHLSLRGAQGADPMSRNHINVLTSDLVLALPGGAGTLSEVRLALEYGKPVLAYLEDREEIPGLPASVQLASRLEDVVDFVRVGLGRR
ncbi:MAG: hypothetical protein HKN73_16545 [Gemmatimonadetes bacterium]|nr:hypothetical protein [Gemmatimonadota bacterium]